VALVISMLLYIAAWVRSTSQTGSKVDARTPAL
jgi:hypothetical protein